MNIEDATPTSCTGCGICVINCPFEAIEIKLHNGYFFPRVDHLKCVDCGSCKNDCVKYHDAEMHDEFRIKNKYAAQAREKSVAENSSSGGIAQLLSREVLRGGGIVCGVTYNKRKHVAEHIVIENDKGLERINGTKYIQSYTVGALSFLRDSEQSTVKLVVGTPCQIRALRMWMTRKNRDDIILVDLFCQGIPSYYVFEKYLAYIKKNYRINDSCDVKFRDKKTYKWHDCGMTVFDELTTYSKHGGADYFLSLFNSGLCFNDACYECKWKADYSYADIRLGDFWGRRFEGDDLGVSIVTCQTEKGKEIFSRIKAEINCYEFSQSDYEDAISGLINKKTKKVTKMRELLYDNHEDIQNIFNKLVKPTLPQRLYMKMMRVDRKCILK